MWSGPKRKNVNLTRGYYSKWAAGIPQG